MALDRSTCFALLFVYLSMNCFNSFLCEVVNLNYIADPALEDFRRRITLDGQSKVPVGDFSSVSRVKIFGLGIKLLRFHCSNGWVSDISSIERAGDVLMYPVENAVAVEVPFAFQKLQYNCDSYVLDVPIVKFDGKLSASVGYNKFDLKVRVEFVNEECTFKVDKFKILNLDDIQVNLTGFGVFNKLFDKIVTGIAGKFKEAISSRILNKIKESLVANVEMANLCRHNMTIRH